MLVVKIELHSARTHKITEIGRMIIANEGTAGTPRRGNYTVKVGRKGHHSSKDVWLNPTRMGRVKDYPRLTYSVWRLVIRALLSAFPEETTKR